MPVRVNVKKGAGTGLYPPTYIHASTLQSNLHNYMESWLCLYYCQTKQTPRMLVFGKRIWQALPRGCANASCHPSAPVNILPVSASVPAPSITIHYRNYGIHATKFIWSNSSNVVWLSNTEHSPTRQPSVKFHIVNRGMQTYLLALI